MMPSPTSFFFPISPDINAIQLLHTGSGPQKISSQAHIPIPKNVIGFKFVYESKASPMPGANAASTVHTKAQIPNRRRFDFSCSWILAMLTSFKKMLHSS